MGSNRKRRILFTGEASFLATGFSTYWNEVLRRIYPTGEFEIAELGSYAHDDDPRCQQVPWKFYPVGPARSDHEAMQRYMPGPGSTNQFGEWRFNDICLDFQPDIVCGIRDWWMDEFILRSPLRHNFKFIWMPTIDGEPQRELWLDSYKQCDYILTYSEYGMRLLKKTGRRDTPLVTVASPGADLEMFKPVPNKREHKQKMGIDPNSIIIGTVMRNQKRKLYYDLIEAFSKWLHRSKTKGHTKLTKETFLYLHTSYPDVGYDIGKAIRDFGVGNKVIMTYLCGNCNTAYPALFSGDMAICRRCNKLAAHPPNANHSCPRNVLADIMNAFDLYVQYSICLHPETPIMTSNGWENIGDINVGDQVIGKDGELHRVYKTMRNPSNTCYDVTVKSRPWSITATDNHPWLVVSTEFNAQSTSVTGSNGSIESIVNRERYHKNRGTQCPKLKFTYKRTDELNPGDLLASRIPNDHQFTPKHNLPFLTDTNTANNPSSWDEDMAYYLGLFAAGDGINLDHIKTIAQRMGNEVRTRLYNDRDAFDADINCKEFMWELRDTLYHKDKTKQLPIGCHLWSRKLQERLVAGLLAGDGYQKNEHLNVYCTTSIHIAKMLCPLLERLGLYYCCHIQYRDGKLPMYRFEIRTDGQRKSHETLYHNGFVLTEVASSNISNFDGEVVNIDVEDDHHYVTLEGLQHNCEGWGMPLTEAQACGVPTMAVRYSAMEDHLQNPTSIPIEVERFFWEAIIETEQKRALPNNIDFINKLERFIKLPEDIRIGKTQQTRQYIEEMVETYKQPGKMRRRGWERTAAIWTQVIRDCNISDPLTTWQCPTARIRKPNMIPPSNNMNNVEFVNWVIGQIWGRKDMLRTHFAGEWLKALNSGSRTQGDKRTPFDRQQLVNHFMTLVNQNNEIEQHRIALLNGPKIEHTNVTVI